MVHWHLSWLVYLFVELKTGAAIALVSFARYPVILHDICAELG